ncbi:MAG TPA: peptide deformylase [Syntrophaceticus sp.]|jgi:peptide deformylase|uniref:Peptide deformylase n=1 Tax=Syntrophaceticus schinkii TaxID=499207 RepID=A0A0B7MME1_9FIRM|nr:peptide deformylase [Syntrophaceticus schinkii]HHY30145.1 peptide deformylase [Syntrophaceticus sp.]MDD2359229.1 peptide deformylase [Syntrophaceticus schinkii]MDD4261079.1 peptide deformylase [Syntrophaceticus schinkii]MDD4674545.1 peptide deformylase [Syntrophaceticus schinkii]CEO89408.1 peptide deformylase [Syntrophaceticus schinkii]
MAALKIVEIGEPVLRQKCREVTVINKKIKKLLDRMKEAMYKANGVGLAAPQVGVSKRIVVVDVGEGVWELINPEIIFQEGEELGIEGCLSIPGVAGEVSRAARVRVRALNRQGQQQVVTAEGLGARALQHEIDHLDGILFIDKAIKISRQES